MVSATMLPAFLALFAILLAPAAVAYEPAVQVATPESPPCMFQVQLGCFHEDCSALLGCIRLFCPVYVRHTDHAAANGCTPP